MFWFRNIKFLLQKHANHGFKCFYSSDKTINRQLKFAAYQPKNVENKELPALQQHPNGTNFSMIFPPPNITGDIHLGHCLTATIQDVIVRWRKSEGANIQWIFGMDHAGIATQVVVEKILAKKLGKTRHDIGREAFIDEIYKWKDEKGDGIKKDLKKLAASFNWEREYFTMNERHSDAVNEAFIRLFERGIIYRGSSLINWSCALESAISDVEVENLEIQGKTQLRVPNYDTPVTFGVITDFAYKIANSNDEIVVSTTRPETMLGDVAVAVHPDDSRYSHLANAKLVHPYRNDEIPLIFDESVDPEFGTGAVKITPAHDRNDFEVAKRHKLKSIQVINEKGKIRDEFEGYSGLPRFAAREKLVNDLADKNLLRNVKDHNMSLPICSRSKDIIEFMLKDQWFVDCKEMSRKALEAVRSKKLKIVPEIFEREWFRWLENCHDWCISRQLWWGHKAPAYKITKSDGSIEWMAGRSVEEIQNKIKDENCKIERDPDVLDTWFSSALLPFSSFGWPNEIDRQNFPLTLMETGHDILFFWVARMVMLSMELTGEIPFKEVLLHGIVCDAFGRKMSKSLGNVILPDQIIYGASLKDLQSEIEASVSKGIIDKSELKKSLDGQRKMFPNGIQECGVDALRFTLCSQNIKQHFINFDVNECVTNKLFFNKIWQATKYAINFAESRKLNVKEMSDIERENLSQFDLWILSRLGSTMKNVESTLTSFNFHLTTAALKTFFYNDFCDVYLETTKDNDQDAAAFVLNICLAIGLKPMSFFTPYLTHELLPYLPENPKIQIESFIDSNLESKISDLLEICKSIRELKAHLKVTKKIKAEIVILTNDEEKNFLNSNIKHIKHLTFSDDMKIISNSKDFEDQKFSATSTAGHLCSFGIKIQEDSKESSKSSEEINKKKLVKLEKELANMLNIISNPGYREKANEKVQQKHFEKIEKIKAEIENIKRIGEL